jgi:hypothetical protein
MTRNLLTFVFLLLTPAFGFSQVKIEGPKEVTVGYRVKAKLTITGDDVVLKCYPANDDWMAVQDWAGQKYIDFVPGKKSLAKGAKSALFTFVIACNKAGKTYLETWEVTVKADTDEPDPEPQPAPDDAVRNTTLYKDLLAAYKTSPNAEAKGKLLSVYTQFAADVAADKFAHFKEADASLKDVTPKKVGDELHPLRDAVAAYLVTNCGQSGAAWNKDKLATAMSKVIAAIKKIPD